MSVRMSGVTAMHFHGQLNHGRMSLATQHSRAGNHLCSGNNSDGNCNEQRLLQASDSQSQCDPHSSDGRQGGILQSAHSQHHLRAVPQQKPYHAGSLDIHACNSSREG